MGVGAKRVQHAKSTRFQKNAFTNSWTKKKFHRELYVVGILAQRLTLAAETNQMKTPHQPTMILSRDSNPGLLPYRQLANQPSYQDTIYANKRRQQHRKTKTAENCGRRVSNQDHRGGPTGHPATQPTELPRLRNAPVATTKCNTEGKTATVGGRTHGPISPKPVLTSRLNCFHFRDVSKTVRCAGRTAGVTPDSSVLC